MMWLANWNVSWNIKNSTQVTHHKFATNSPGQWSGCLVQQMSEHLSDNLFGQRHSWIIVTFRIVVFGLIGQDCTYSYILSHEKRDGHAIFSEDVPFRIKKFSVIIWNNIAEYSCSISTLQVNFSHETDLVSYCKIFIVQSHQWKFARLHRTSWTNLWLGKLMDLSTWSTTLWFWQPSSVAFLNLWGVKTFKNNMHCHKYCVLYNSISITQSAMEHTPDHCANQVSKLMCIVLRYCLYTLFLLQLAKMNLYCWQGLSKLETLSSSRKSLNDRQVWWVQNT